MIPMPPIHCIRARQMVMECDIPSTDVSTVHPVVVKPDIASKKASLMPMGLVLNRNGIIPKKENTIHTEAVSRKPSCRPISVRRGRSSVVRAIPVRSVTVSATAKAERSASLYITAVSIGTMRKPASIIRSHPSTRSSMA